MGFFNKLFGKEDQSEPTKRRSKPDYEFDDIDREHALSMRRMNREMRMMELQMQRMEMQARMEEMKAELYGDNEEPEKAGSPEDMILNTLIANVMKGQQQQTQLHPNNINHPPNTLGVVTQQLSDDQIREYLQKQDIKIIQQAKSTPKVILKPQVQSQTGMDDPTFERAHKILMEEF